jgi:hypothetical protein
MKCLYDIFGSHWDFFDDLVLPAGQDLIIHHTHTHSPSLGSVIYRMKQLRLMTHLLYRLVQHCPPDRWRHSVGSNSEQNSWWMCRSALSAANSPTNCCGVYPLSMYRAKRQQYAPQTVVVGPWSCFLLYCQTVQWRRMKSRIEGICG